MRVDVDEAGRDDTTLRVDLGAPSTRNGADRGDPRSGNGYVSFERLAAGPVDDEAASNHQIEMTWHNGGPLQTTGIPGAPLEVVVLVALLRQLALIHRPLFLEVGRALIPEDRAALAHVIHQLRLALQQLADEAGRFRFVVA